MAENAWLPAHEHRPFLVEAGKCDEPCGHLPRRGHQLTLDVLIGVHIRFEHSHGPFLLRTPNPGTPTRTGPKDHSPRPSPKPLERAGVELHYERVLLGGLPKCEGIVVVHRDLSLTCTQDPCPACGPAHPPGSDAWIFAHSSYYGCDFVLGNRCPRCASSLQVASSRQNVGENGGEPSE